MTSIAELSDYVSAKVRRATRDLFPSDHEVATYTARMTERPACDVLVGTLQSALPVILAAQAVGDRDRLGAELRALTAALLAFEQTETDQ